MYVMMNYPCMYLCIYFYNICTMICDWQVSGEEKKNYGCHWNFFFFFPPLWDSITLSFCCFKYCSTPQGVICKLSFSTFMITVRLLTNYRNYSVSHLRNIVINWFVLYVQVLHLCKDLVFQHYSHDYTITQQGEHFWLLQIAPFLRHVSLCKLFFYPFPVHTWLCVNASWI